MVNACQTLREGEVSVFLCEPETFWPLQLQNRNFQGQSVLNASSRRSDIIYKIPNCYFETFLALSL